MQQVSWLSLGMIFVATGVLTVHGLRNNSRVLSGACLLLFAGILIEKGLGTIVPGFIPEPWGRVDEYLPTGIEIVVSLGLWAMGAFVFTVLAKIALPIELGIRRAEKESR